MIGTLALYLANCVNSQIAQSASQLFQPVYRNISANCGDGRLEAGVARVVACWMIVQALGIAGLVIAFGALTRVVGWRYAL